MPDSPPAIYRCLAAARAAVDGYIKKDKRVDAPGAKYAAVTHDNVTAHTRQAFIDAGVLVLPSLRSDAVSPAGQTKSGTPIIRYEAVFDIAFVSVEDGSSHTISVSAHANDHGDKAPGKCLSYACKSGTLKVLLIETGEDDESRVPPPEPVLTAEEAASLEGAVSEVGDPGAFLKGMGADSFETFPARLLPAALKQIERKRKAAELKEARETVDEAPEEATS